jgi:hypothetical protein
LTSNQYTEKYSWKMLQLYLDILLPHCWSNCRIWLIYQLEKWEGLDHEILFTIEPNISYVKQLKVKSVPYRDYTIFCTIIVTKVKENLTKIMGTNGNISFIVITSFKIWVCVSWWLNLMGVGIFGGALLLFIS